MKHLLVIRNSAMGDVALTVPAIKTVLSIYSEVRITFVSQKKFRPFFLGEERLEFFETDLKGRHKGFLGILRLYQDIKKHGEYDAVLDLHSVLRSWILSGLFRVNGLPVYRLDKGRKEKRAITRKKNKVFNRSKPAYQRYADVFGRAGYPVDFGELEQQWIVPKEIPFPVIMPKNGKVRIGIAPFARHKGKTWPIAKMERLIQELLTLEVEIFLFGGGEKEILVLSGISDKYESVSSLAGKYTLEEEMAFMAKTHLMVTMDSANLHIASLLGVQVVSIWGATHSNAGFEPIGKNKERKVEIDPGILTCRPCSVFGNKPCYRKDYACLNRLKVEQVMAVIRKSGVV